MEIVVIKGAEPGQRDSMWVTRRDGSTAQVPINMAHELPHLVVESVFGIEFGFWGLVAAGAFANEVRASRSRDPRRAKAGRAGVLVGRPGQSPLRAEGTDDLLARHTGELMAAKALTNVFRAWGGSPPGPPEIRARLASVAHPVVGAVLARITDSDIEAVLAGLPAADAAWRAVGPGEKLRLRWPLERRMPGPADGAVDG